MMNYLDKAEAIGIAIANGMFCDMLNPKYRGTNFRWENFEDICAKHAKLQTFMAYPQNTFLRHKKAILERSEGAARYRAKECLESSGVMEWLKL